VKNKGKTKNDRQPAVAFGGLDDDDVEQENPFPVHVSIGHPAQVKYPPNLQRDVSRKNAVRSHNLFFRQIINIGNAAGHWHSGRVFGKAICFQVMSH
jgi:hypothetical protein